MNTPGPAHPATAELDSAVAGAVASHRAGKLDAAAAAYRAILQTHPAHPGVLHNLGVIAAQRGAHEEALALFERALAVRPDYPDAHLNRAGVLNALGRNGEALAAYDRAIALRPDHPAAYDGKGDVLRRRMRLDEAAQCYEQALARHPHDYSVHRKLGLLRAAQDRRTEALAQFRHTLTLRRGAQPIDPAHYSFHYISRAKLRHDIAQFRYLAAQGTDAPGFAALAHRYEAIDAALGWPPGDDSRLMQLPQELRATIAGSYNRPIHLVDAPEIPEGALDPRLDAAAIVRAYKANSPGVAWFDHLLTKPALDALRRFLLGSTIWFDFAHIGGFVAAYLEDGMACPLLLQIAAELRQAFPGLLQDHPLSQAWAFKCLHGERGIDVHADAAAVSLNFWITPDAANLAPAQGGLIVYHALPPPDWRLKGYDSDIGPIRAFLRDQANQTTVIPYGENRAVFFNSDLFHESDAVQFRPGYENHRINITMLFGERLR